MAATKELVDALIERFPEDAQDLQDALEVLLKQKISSCDRLGRLTDAQWQRVGLPIGIETILRDAVEAMQRGEAEVQAAAAEPPPTPAPAAVAQPPPEAPRQSQPPLEALQKAQAPPPVTTPVQFDDDGSIALEPFESSEGLRRRSGGGGSSSRGGKQPARDSALAVQSSASSTSQSAARKPEGEKNGLLSPMDLTPPPDLDLLWQQLLEDTLPPDKRAALQDSWNHTVNENDRYMMFLEYSSYLRRPEITEEEKEERRKQLEPLMKEFGINSSDNEESGWDGLFITLVIAAVIAFICVAVYYGIAWTDEPLHDGQVL